MTDDILTRLQHQWTGEFDPTGELLHLAAKEIERLRKKVNAPVDAFVLKADEVLVIQAQSHATLEECGHLISNIPEELRKRVLVLRDIEVVRSGL